MTWNRPLRRVLGAVLALTGLLALSGCTVGMPDFGDKIEITAYFTSASGVFVGNDVGVLGVSVGTISKIEPEGGRVRVVLSVDADQPIPADAKAVVVPRSVATDRYIELTPVYHSGPRMHDGAVIGLDRTRVPVEFDQVLDTLKRFATTIGGSKRTRGAIKRFLAAGSRALDGNGDLINRSIRSLGSATDGLARQRENGTATLTALDHLTNTLADNQQTVRTFVKQVTRASDLLAHERGSFRRALHNVTRMIKVVARFARHHRTELTRAVHRTNGVLHTVLDRRKQVAEILRVTPLAMQNLTRALTPDGKLRVRLDFVALLPVLGPVLEKVCEVPALSPVCNSIGLDPSGILDLLTGLFGGSS